MESPEAFWTGLMKAALLVLALLLLVLLLGR
jgi:hypothetical protein